MATKKVSKLYLYLGAVMNYKKKLHHSYIDVTEINNNGARLDRDQEDELWYKKALFSSSPGSIHKVESEDDSNTIVNAHLAEYFGRWENSKDVEEWEVKSKAIFMLSYAHGKAAKQMRKRIHQETLDPIRDAYRRNPQMRAQILAIVIRYITSTS